MKAYINPLTVNDVNTHRAFSKLFMVMNPWVEELPQPMYQEAVSG